MHIAYVLEHGLYPSATEAVGQVSNWFIMRTLSGVCELRRRKLYRKKKLRGITPRRLKAAKTEAVQTEKLRRSTKMEYQSQSLSCFHVKEEAARLYSSMAKNRSFLQQDPNNVMTTLS